MRNDTWHSAMTALTVVVFNMIIAVADTFDAMITEESLAVSYFNHLMQGKTHEQVRISTYFVVVFHR